MVVAKSEDMYKGSIRSGNKLDLTSFFEDFKKELSAYGGHPAAAGIGFENDKKQLIQDYVNQKMQGVELCEEHGYQAIDVTMEELTMKEVESLTILAPFGNGFEEPIFYVQHVQTQSMKALSNGAHAKWIINDACEAMYFRCGEALEQLQDKRNLNFVGNLRINTFMKKKKVNIFVLDAQ